MLITSRDLSYPTVSPPPLFRAAAVDACQTKWLGEVVLVRPLSFLVLTTLAIGMALLLIFFMLFFSYTKRTTVTGHLVPNAGVAILYAPQAGIVLEKHINEGQLCKKGDVLYIMSSERHNETNGAIQASISRQVALRDRSLRDELRQMRLLQKDEDYALRKKIQGLQNEHTQVVNQIAGQRVRIEISEAAVQRAELLRAQGYFSIEMSQSKEADLIDQRNRLKALDRDRLSLEAQLEAQRDELASLPLRQRNQSGQVERLITNTTQEWTESESKRRIAVVAPVSGTASAVTAEIGQAVDGARALVSIVPDGALLQAHLFAPSRAIGFIRHGDRVLLRHQAYPYQKFGLAEGVVQSVSRTALSANEVGGTATIANGEPLYRITVALSHQTVTAYGKSQPLKAGMLVEGDIQHERRKLYEWVLEPLYSLTGKL
jgi:membrane fusion protein